MSVCLSQDPVRGASGQEPADTEENGRHAHRSKEVSISRLFDFN